MKFQDLAKIYITSGNGGHGCLSFRREKFLEFGGPDGGNGGRGGDVVAEAVAGLNTLIDFRYQQHVKAKNGRPGEGRNRTGANGRAAVIRVPAGTEILEEDKETVLADLTEIGERTVVALGGRGGRGNATFKSSTNRAPRRADAGEPGESFTLWLRLKLIADAGLVGLPNAGKSTFLARVSHAKPKIADYPFTTLYPHLGVVEIADAGFVLADIPGLIAGAHEGTGLGDRFLGHIERCRVLLHLVDGTGEDVAGAYRTIRSEIEAYGHDLSSKAEIVALNKCDALTDEAIRQRRQSLEAACGKPVITLSSASGHGVNETVATIIDVLQQTQAESGDGQAATASEWQPI